MSRGRGSLADLIMYVHGILSLAIGAWATTLPAAWRSPARIAPSWRSPQPVATLHPGGGGDNAQAQQAVAWFDELTVLEVVYGEDLEHDGATAAMIEIAISALGGNVSAVLTPDERTLPDDGGGGTALNEVEVSFAVLLDGGGVSAGTMPAGDVRLRVAFADGYPLGGGVPEFELACADGLLPAAGVDAVLGAARDAAAQALADGEAACTFVAVSAANDAMADGAWRGAQGGGGPAAGSMPSAPRPPPQGAASRSAPPPPAAVPPAMPPGVRWCSWGELDAAKAAFAARSSGGDGGGGGGDGANGGGEGDDGRRLAEASCWDWYEAARELRSQPALHRGAPGSFHAGDPFGGDDDANCLHLFAPTEGSLGGATPLCACALLRVDRLGRGSARLAQLCVAEHARSAGFECEVRMIETAQLLAERYGHRWVAVSAPEGSLWRDALVVLSFRAQRAVPPGEGDGEWLTRGTALLE